MIEEASGKVYPTTAPSPENGDRKPSRVTPETLAPSNSGQTGGTGHGSGQTSGTGPGKRPNSGNWSGSGPDGGTGSGKRPDGGTRPGKRPDGGTGSGKRPDGGIGSGKRPDGGIRPGRQPDGRDRPGERSDIRQGVRPRLIQPRKKNEQTESGNSHGSPDKSLRLMIPHFRQPEEEGNQMTRPCQLPATRCIPWRTVGTLYGIWFKLYHNLQHIDEICRVNSDR